MGGEGSRVLLLLISVDYLMWMSLRWKDSGQRSTGQWPEEEDLGQQHGSPPGPSGFLAPAPKATLALCPGRNLGDGGLKSLHNDAPCCCLNSMGQGLGWNLAWS